MKVSAHSGGFCQTNGYLLETAKGAVAIDAPEGMFNFCKQRDCKPTGLLLTHQHFDHIEDAALFDQAGIPIYASEPFQPELQPHHGSGGAPADREGHGLGERKPSEGPAHRHPAVNLQTDTTPL